MGPWGVRLTWLDCNWIKSFGKLKMDRGFCHTGLTKFEYLQALS